MTDQHQANELRAFARVYEDRAAYYEILARVYGRSSTLGRMYQLKAAPFRYAASIFRVHGNYVTTYAELDKRLAALAIDISDPMVIPDLFTQTVEVECDCDGECAGEFFEQRWPIDECYKLLQTGTVCLHCGGYARIEPQTTHDRRGTHSVSTVRCEACKQLQVFKSRIPTVEPSNNREFPVVITAVADGWRRLSQWPIMSYYDIA